MFGSLIIDVAIGVIFLYLLLSLLCTSIREGIESVLKVRAAMLQEGLREMLQDPTGNNLVKPLYESPLIDCLFRGVYNAKENLKPNGVARLRSRLPTYIPAANFARALVDIMVRGPSSSQAAAPPAAAAVAPAAGPAAITIDSIRQKLTNPGDPVQRVVLQALDTATDLPTLYASLEQWFNNSMDRVSGWYKRQTQIILFLIGIVVTVAVNGNTITTANYLFSNKTARDQVVTLATQAPGTGQEKLQQEDTTRLRELVQIGLPIGWHWDSGAPWPEGSIVKRDDWGKVMLASILGWLLTAFAISLGAPFWFDLLSKIVQVRSTMKPKPKAKPATSGSAPDSVALAVAPQSVVIARPPNPPAGGAGFKAQAWAGGDPQAGDL
jgi:hypothetical protein